MKVTSKLINLLHLDPRQLLLSARSVKLVHCLFETLDVEDKGYLDDLAFVSFMVGCTDLAEQEAYKVFDIFDVDCNGSIEFDEFYLIVCIMVALKDGQQKQFLWNHSRTCFELIDADGSQAVSRNEFEAFSFMFNISKKASRDIFKDFDKDNSEELDYEEFRMFTMACLDKQVEIDQRYLVRPQDNAIGGAESIADRQSLNQHSQYSSFKLDASPTSSALYSMEEAAPADLPTPKRLA